MTARLIYGFDPLCGWCFGVVPAMRAVVQAFPDLPITLAMPGLVKGVRVGPYAEMEVYIRNASTNLRRVTGRAPTEAFFDLIRTPGVKGDSGPPIAAIAQVLEAHPDKALGFAHAVTEAHFLEGADLNRVAPYDRIAAEMGLAVAFDLADHARIARVQAEGRRHGIASFPTLMVEVAGQRTVLPSVYDPGQVVGLIERALGTLRNA